MKNVAQNEVNSIKPAVIFNHARDLLSAGIARICRWPTSAFDCQGNPVSLKDKNATYFTPSGAVIRSLINYGANDPENTGTASAYIEAIAKYLPETHMHKYELATAFDLACFRKTDDEIISVFERIITDPFLG